MNLKILLDLKCVLNRVDSGVGLVGFFALLSRDDKNIKILRMASTLLLISSRIRHIILLLLFFKENKFAFKYKTVIQTLY